MTVAQLNLRGRMVYGIACVIAYLRHCRVDLRQYAEEIEVLARFTSAADLAAWEGAAKGVIYAKYPDEVLHETIPALFDKLYWIGASELYGQPSDCRESEEILVGLVALLRENGVDVPAVGDYAAYALGNPVTTDDYFGEPFL